MKIVIDLNSEMVGVVGGKRPKVNVLGKPVTPPFFNRFMISDTQYCVLPTTSTEPIEIEVKRDLGLDDLVPLFTEEAVQPKKKGQ